jgi:hypothetical protein
MPKPRSRQKLNAPSEKDIALAVKENLEVIAFAPAIKGQYLFLKMKSRSGVEITFYVDPIKADYMRRILQESLPPDDDGGSPTRWAIDASPQAYGFVPVST